MRLELNDDEIREALAEALSAKTQHVVLVDAETAWFECHAEEVDGSECRDIHEMRFCYVTPEAE